jgi:hypothetical protein
LLSDKQTSAALHLEPIAGHFFESKLEALMQSISGYLDKRLAQKAAGRP